MMLAAALPPPISVVVVVVRAEEGVVAFCFCHTGRFLVRYSPNARSKALLVEPA
jgi:hypothetical protein